MSENLFDKAREIAGKAIDAAEGKTEKVKGILDDSKEYVKLRHAIAAAEVDLQEKLYNYGKVCYYGVTYSGERAEAAAAVSEAVHNLDELKEKLEELDKKLTKVSVCPQCGAKNDKEKNFCGNCGSKLN